LLRRRTTFCALPPAVPVAWGSAPIGPRLWPVFRRWWRERRQRRGLTPTNSRSPHAPVSWAHISDTAFRWSRSRVFCPEGCSSRQRRQHAAVSRDTGGAPSPRTPSRRAVAAALAWSAAVRRTRYSSSKHVLRAPAAIDARRTQPGPRQPASPIDTSSPSNFRSAASAAHAGPGASIGPERAGIRSGQS